MAELFRKTSLEKLSSPEQLDKMIVITPPSFWIAMLGVGGIVGAALLWAVLGRLPVNVEAQGIYLNGGDVYSLYSDTTGVIDEITVKEGDAVEAGDIIAYLDTDSIQEKLDDYGERIRKVKAVTMDSENDVVTADNKNLMDIKGQLLSVDQTLRQDSALLKLRQEKLAEQRQKTLEAERKMRETEAAYYNSLKIPDTLAQQLSYTDAQARQANASGYLESAYGSFDQAEIAYTQAQGEYDQARSAYIQAVAQEEALKADAENKKNILDRLSAENSGGTTDGTIGTTGTTGGTTDGIVGTPDDIGETSSGIGETAGSTEGIDSNAGDVAGTTGEISGDFGTPPGDLAQLSDVSMELSEDSAISSGNTGDVAGISQELRAAQAAYEEAVANYNNFKASGAAEQAKNSMDSMGLALDAAFSTRNNYQNDVSRYASEKSNADAAYDEAKSAYISAAAAQIAAQAGQSEKSNEYNIALTNYNTEHSTLLSLEDGVDQLKVQVEVDWEVKERQIKVLYNQFEVTKSSIIDQLKSESRQYESQKEDCTVRAAVGGSISTVSIVRGSIVQPGSELVKVKQEEGQEEVVICYMPLSQGKKVTEGMTVFVYPTTVNRQEYGHMEALVESIDTYVSSTDDLRTQLGNDNLVESFLQNGPVVAITCRLKEDAATESGYYWSNRKGKDLTLMEGTLVEASIVVEEKAPISMLVPYLKEKLTVKEAEQ